MSPKLFLLWLFLLHFGVVGGVGVGALVCDEGLAVHEEKDGALKCCEPVECDAGKFSSLEECGENNTKIYCLDCPENTYRSSKTMSTWNVHNCDDMTICDPDTQEILRAGTKFSNRICICRPSFYNYDGEDREDPGQEIELCLEKSCPAMKEMDFESGICRPCKNGTEKNQPGTNRCIAKRQDKNFSEDKLASGDSFTSADWWTTVVASLLVFLIMVGGMTVAVRKACWYHYQTYRGNATTTTGHQESTV